MKFHFILLGLANLFLLLSCSSAPMISTQNRSGSNKKNHENSATHSAPTPMREAVIVRPTPLNSNNSNNTAPVPAPLVDAAVPTVGLPVSTKVKNEESQPKLVSNISFSTNHKKIGVILPLTGKNAVLGQRALSAIRIGLNISGTSDFSLALYDTQGNADLAAKGVEKLLQDDQVIAILGGLGAKEASSIAGRAEFFQVPFFAFSQKSDLTNDAKFTFRNSVTPAMQASKLVEYAITKLGYKKFAILYPNDAYGIEFANQFWDYVLAYGGFITAAQVYDPKDVDLTSYIQKMVGTFYVDGREEEYKNKVELLKEKKQKKITSQLNASLKKSRENEANENILEPIVDFDAIFIPDSSKAMGQAIGFFRAADVTKMTYLGTNLWNTEDLTRRAGQTTVNGANHFYFVDAVITEAQRKKSDFNSLFVKTYNEEPSIIEVQTYESAKILSDLILSGARDRYSLANRLKELGHRQGAFSEIYMNNSNEIVRDLSVLTLENGSILPQ